jgi:hypothetical protein
MSTRSERAPCRRSILVPAHAAATVCRGLKKVERLLSEHEHANVTVPYKENRAVLFDSHLFHVSGAGLPGFKNGLKNRRINLTFLFGIKGETCQTG